MAIDRNARRTSRPSLRSALAAAVAWTDGTSAVVRTWSRRRVVRPPRPPACGPEPPITQTRTARPIALSGTAGVGVAWTRLRHGLRRRGASATRANLVWSESQDGGASWFAGQVIGSSAASTARRYNDYPSILWPSATVRHVLWNAGTAGTNAYRLVLRTGTGQVAATAATQAAGVPSEPDDDGISMSPETGRRSPGAP